jgi:hypothetical protein
MTVDNSLAFSRDELVMQLESMGQKVRGANATCPWHEDRNASASIHADLTGHWRVTCHAGCDRSEDVYGLRDEKPTPTKAEPRKVPRIERKAAHLPILKDKAAVKEYCERSGTVERWYKYGPSAAPLMVVARIVRDGKKTFRQFSACPGGYQIGKAEGMTPPLYFADQLAGYQSVLLVEGEKCVEAAWSVGIPATTSMGGAEGAARSDWSALAGKTVTIWPDNDDPGRKYANDAQEILTLLGCTVRRLDPAAVDLPAKGDLADLVARGVARAELEAFISDAAPVGQSGIDDLLEWQKDVLAGKWECLPWPQQRIGTMSRAALPGAITMLCSDPGAGKSFLVLQLLRYWTACGHKVGVLMFEDGKKEHLARCLAQMTRNGNHTDDVWMRDNPERVRIDTAQHLDDLRSIDRCIQVEKDDEWSAEEVLEWAENHAKAGARVLMLDPITAIKPSKEPWLQDFRVCMGLKRIAKEYQLSVIVTTHPRSSTKEPSMTGMAGGTAWSRFAHTVLWLTAYSTPWKVRLANGEPTAINRAVHILKCRYGRGSGVVIGVNFGHAVQHEEAGILAQETGEDQPEKHHRKKRKPTGPQQTEDVFI